MSKGQEVRAVKPTILLRVRLTFLVMALVGLGILVRLGQVQFGNAQEWEELAHARHDRIMDIPATRGNIYSENGRLLATSLPFYRVAFDPSISTQSQAAREIYYEGLDSLCENLSVFFGDRSAKSYRRMLNEARAQNRRYLRLNPRQISYHEKKELSQWPIFREGKLRGGVIFEQVEERFYPFHPLAARTLGFVNEQNKGAGLEMSFNKYLAGTQGQGLFTKMGGGIWKPVEGAENTEAEPGLDIVTTLDVNMQDVVEYELRKALEEHQADYGCVVILEVGTGKVKAMANLGRQKSGLYEGRYLEDYNYAVGVGTDPGSTFKLASIMAVLEETDIELTDSVNCGTGERKYYNATMHDVNPWGYGMLSVQQVFEKSSNIGLSGLVVSTFGHNVQSQLRFVEYLDRFGLTDTLGFQIDGEARPVVKRPGQPGWSGISLPWMSIGYETQLSALQICAFYNAVASDGRFVQPYIVKEVRRGQKTVETYQPRVISEQVCSEKTLAQCRQLLQGVVDHGTARNIYTENYAIAGKTGTAQKVRSGSYTSEYYASFVGYFPADRPKYTMIVAVDHPRGEKKHGGEVAAPIFRQISDILYSRDVDMHPSHRFVREEGAEYLPGTAAGDRNDLLTVCRTLRIPLDSLAVAGTWVRASPGPQGRRWVGLSLTSPADQVPDVRAMTLRDALYQLENLGLRVRWTGRGHVKTQSLAPGSELVVGTTVNLTLAP